MEEHSVVLLKYRKISEKCYKRQFYKTTQKIYKITNNFTVKYRIIIYYNIALHCNASIKTFGQRHWLKILSVRMFGAKFKRRRDGRRTMGDLDGRRTMGDIVSAGRTPDNRWSHKLSLSLQQASWAKKQSFLGAFNRNRHRYQAQIGHVRSQCQW